MGNITNNNNKNAGIVILVLWIITVVPLAYRCYFEIMSFHQKISQRTPVDAELSDGEVESLERTITIIDDQIGDQLDDATHTEQNDNNYYSNEERIIELHEEKVSMIVISIIVLAYLVFGIVSFILLRRKENTRAILFALLAIINVVFLLLLPDYYATH